MTYISMVVITTSVEVFPAGSMCHIQDRLASHLCLIDSSIIVVVLKLLLLLVLEFLFLAQNCLFTQTRMAVKT